MHNLRQPFMNDSMCIVMGSDERTSQKTVQRTVDADRHKGRSNEYGMRVTETRFCVIKIIAGERTSLTSGEKWSQASVEGLRGNNGASLSDRHVPLVAARFGSHCDDGGKIVRAGEHGFPARERGPCGPRARGRVRLRNVRLRPASFSDARPCRFQSRASRSVRYVGTESPPRRQARVLSLD